MASVRWTGAAGLEITSGGKTWLIDPYVSRIGKLDIFFGRPSPDAGKVAARLASLPGELQAAAVSHTHVDHAFDVPEIARRSPAPIIGSASLDTLMTMHGMPGRVNVCRGGERVELPGGASVTMIPSLHGRVLFGRVPYPGEIDPAGRPPLAASDYRHGTVFIIKFEIDGLALMHIGSANLIDEEMEGQTCDVLFLCLPGWRNAPDFPARVLSKTKPRVVVPFHFDDFSAPLKSDGSAPKMPLLSIEHFREQISVHAPRAEIVTPRIFRSMDF